MLGPCTYLPRHNRGRDRDEEIKQGRWLLSPKVLPKGKGILVPVAWVCQWCALQGESGSKLENLKKSSKTKLNFPSDRLLVSFIETATALFLPPIWTTWVRAFAIPRR